MKRGALIAATCLLGCRPAFDETSSLITGARVLAVRAEPAEGPPGSRATYDALVATPDPSLEPPSVSWSWCLAPKSPSENSIVSTTCLRAEGLVPLGQGPTVNAASPTDACALFGPDTPPGGFRPRDPDGTGGYFIPLRVDAADPAPIDPVFYLVRIACHLAQAPTDVAASFANEYLPNVNPHLLPLSARVAGVQVPLDAVRTGARVDLEAAWLPEDAETYRYFDRTSQQLTWKREAMRVAWYASSGSLDTESTGRGEDDMTTMTTNVWTAPSTPGRARLWLVLRDSRGGVDFASYEPVVIP